MPVHVTRSADAARKGTVVAVCRRAEPGLPKFPVEAIELAANAGIEGDYHSGALVRHRYLAKKDPFSANRRQVLLTDTSLLAELAEQGITLEPGMLGENIVVDGIALMSLEIGAGLQIGSVLLEVTEARIPCRQLNGIHPRLLEVVEAKDGRTRPNAGMMARVLAGGTVGPGDEIAVVRLAADAVAGDDDSSGSTPR